MLKKIFFLLLLISIISFSCVSIKIRRQVAIDYYNLGNKYLVLKDYSNAILFFEKSLEYDSQAIETILNLIISYQLNTQYVKVEELIVKYYKKVKYEYSQKLLLILGNNFFYQKKYNQAIKTYDEYLLINSNDANCYFNMGLTYLNLLDEEKALFYFLEAYKKDNKHIPAIYDIAEYYFKYKDFENSIYYYSLLTELDAKNSDAFYKLGLSEYQVGEFDKARDHLLKAIEIDNKKNDYYILLAKIYSKGYKNKTKTIEYLVKAFKNDFKDLKYLKNIEEFKLLFEFEEFKQILKEYNIK